MTRIMVALVFSAIVGSGCGDDDWTGTLIGLSCDDSVECDVAGACVTDGRDGLCTMPCQTSGGIGECPLGSYCDRENVSIDDGRRREETLCFPACDDDDDCRIGYKCDGVSGGPGKVCHPR
jgi:hypothetical protein